MATRPTDQTKPKILISGADFPNAHTTLIREPGLPWSRMSCAVKMDAARHIAYWLLKDADGSIHRPETWKAVARRKNIRCYTSCYRSDGRGSFEGPSREAPEYVGGCIFVNAAYDESEQVRGWVHELAHSILYHWQVGVLAGGADMWQFSDVEEEAHDEIAELVEDLIFG